MPIRSFLSVRLAARGAAALITLVVALLSVLSLTSAAATATQDAVEVIHHTATAEPVRCYSSATSQQCLEFSTSLTASGGRLTGEATVTARESSRGIARVQIDSIAVVTSTGQIAGRGAGSAPGTPGPARSTVSAPLVADSLCHTYALELHTSARAVDGALYRSADILDWVIPVSQECPPRSAINGSFQVPAWSKNQSLTLTSGIGVSADHRSVFAIAQLPLSHGPDVARVQVDDVWLQRSDGTVLARSAPGLAPVTSSINGATNDFADVVSRGFAPVGRCDDVNVYIAYSVRYTDGSLRRFTGHGSGTTFCVT